MARDRRRSCGEQRAVPNKNRTLPALFILCLLGTAVYFRSLSGSFHFDDYRYIIENENIKHLSGLPAIWGFWPSRFITFLSFALDYHFYQFNAFGYHLVNLALHLAASALVWQLARLVLSAPALAHRYSIAARQKIALFAALVFLSHPVQTEAVNYVYQRSTLLGAFFYLAAACLYIKSRLLQLNGGKLPWRLYLSAWFFAACALCSKENTVTLPLSLALCEYAFLRQGRCVKLRYISPFLFLTLAAALVLFFKDAPNRSDILVFLNDRFAVKTYFLTQLRVLVTYIRLVFIPVNQNLDYDYRLVADPLALPVLASGILLFAVLVFAAAIFRKNPPAAFGILWFFLTLLPESSVIPLADAIFEHRLYLPMAGFSLFLAAGTFSLLKGEKSAVAAVCLSLLVAAYSLLSYQRNGAWKNEITLWSDVIKKSPGKPRGYTYLCSSCVEAGRDAEAVYWCSQALRFKPVFPRTYYNLGNAYANLGRQKEAIEAYQKEIALDGGFAEAYNNLAAVYADSGNIKEALQLWNDAIRIKPDFATAHFNLAVFYFQDKQYAPAIAHCDKVTGMGYKVDGKFLELLRPYRK